jgi:type I restriction enzyme S subunit
MPHLETGIPIITAKNVLFDEIDFENTDKTDLSSYQDLTDKSKPVKGDILMVKDGVTLGRPALVDTDETFCISQAVTLVVPKKTVVLPEFLLRYFLSDPVQQKIKGMAKGNAMPHLQITQLAKFPVPTIDIKRQACFIEIIKNIKSQRAQIQPCAGKSESLFNSLIQKAFKGELVN